MAQKLENAGKAGDVELLENEIGELLERARAVGALLKPLVAESGTDGKSLALIRREELERAFAKLKECASEFDSAGVEDILDELSAYKIPEEEKEKLGAVLEAIVFVAYQYSFIADRIMNRLKELGYYMVQITEKNPVSQNLEKSDLFLIYLPANIAAGYVA